MLKKSNPLKFGTTLVVTTILTLGFSVSLQSLLAAWTAPSTNPPTNNMADLNLGGGLSVAENTLVMGNFAASNTKMALFADTTTGNVGIGTISPIAKLQVNQSNNVEGLRIISSNYSPLVIRNAANTADLFRVKEDGNICIGSDCKNAWPTSATSGGSTPINAIAAFNQSTCPTGWVLADGNNGTPDLRGKFVLGTNATYPFGTTGGEAAHILTVAEMPSHGHTYTTRYSTWTGGLVAGGTIGINYNTSNPTSGLTGGGLPHNNMPPYYSLIYCMKNTEGDTSSVWAKNGTSAYYNTGNVGVGTNAPTQKLDVVGNIKATDVCTSGGKCLSAMASIGGSCSWTSYTAYTATDLSRECPSGFYMAGIRELYSDYGAHLSIKCCQF